MDIYNADLHIHSPHSIGVSKSLNLDTMIDTCKKKGLNILGTGDVLQPDWLNYLENKLKKDKDGAYCYKDIYFILQTEIEDLESVHEVILLEDFDMVRSLQKKLKHYSKNILDEWGGRPRVNLSPAELTEIVSGEGALIGPAHAFTPFKAIFRQNKFETLKQCYGETTKYINFIELGLSANTNLADRMSSLKDVTFLSNSDAHSQDPRSLGREFNRFDVDNPSFSEISLAIRRKEGRKIILNVGLHPKLGKYYNMFCSKCRRRILFKKTKKKGYSIFNQFTKTEDFVTFFSDNPIITKKQYIDQVSKNKIVCPACKEERNRNYKIKLGVSERIDVISQYPEPQHPNHRPKYINAIPLIDIIRAVKGIKSTTSKTVLNEYNKIIQKLGTEFEVSIDIPINKIEEYDHTTGKIIEAFRNNKIEYTPGGGGTYGSINFEI
ncbi:MAG: endonuclease Q family protein [Candidatus Hermodarchaeota archaeon]